MIKKSLISNDKKEQRKKINARYYRKTVGTPRGEKNERNKRKSKAKNFILKEATQAELKALDKLIHQRLISKNWLSG